MNILDCKHELSQMRMMEDQVCINCLQTASAIREAELKQAEAQKRNQIAAELQQVLLAGTYDMAVVASGGLIIQTDKTRYLMYPVRQPKKES